MRYAECYYCGNRLNIGDNAVAFAGHKFCDRGCIQGYIDEDIKDFVIWECDCDFEDAEGDAE